MLLLKNEPSVMQALFVLCMFINCLYAGVLFGWAPLQLLLIRDGVFSDRCVDGFDSSGGDSCSAQLERINLLYTIGSTASIVGSIFSGLILDTYGFTTNCALSGVFSFVGYLLLALSPSNSLPLLIVSVCFIGFGGIFAFFCVFGISSMVLKSNIPLVLTGANVFFDCSAVIPLLFYQLYEAEYSRKSIFLSYAALACVVYSLYLVVYYRAYSYRQLHQMDAPVSGDEDGSVESETSVRSVVIGIEIPHKPHRRDRSNSRVSELSDQPMHADVESIAEPVNTGPAIEDFVSLPWTVQIRSQYFLCMTSFCIVMMLRSNIYLGTVQILLEHYNDDEYNYLFTQLFIAILPFGFVFIHLVDYLLKKYGFATFLNIVSLLGIAYGVIAVIPVLYLQVVTFVLYTAYRAFFYSVVATFNACVFGSKNAGRIHGFMFLLAGIVNIVQWPLMLLIFEYANGNVFYLYIALIIICLPSLIYTEIYLRPALLKDGCDVIDRADNDGEVTKDPQSIDGDVELVAERMERQITDSVDASARI